MPDLLVAAALRVEARALRRGLATGGQAGVGAVSVDQAGGPAVDKTGDQAVIPAAVIPSAIVVRTGMGPVRAAAAVPRLLAIGPAVFAVAGVAGALTKLPVAGDVVVASEVRPIGAAEPVLTTNPAGLAEMLRGAGFSVHVGPVVSTDHMVHRRERISLALSGAIAVDMETAMLAGAAGGAPFAALRVIVDTPARPLFHPATLVSGITALRVLSRAAPILRAWAATRMTGSAPRNSRSTLPK